MGKSLPEEVFGKLNVYGLGKRNQEWNRNKTCKLKVYTKEESASDLKRYRARASNGELAFC